MPPTAKQRAWTVREANGVVLLHYDPDGNPPEFEIPTIEEYGSPDWLDWSTSFYHIKTHPREVVDNLADKDYQLARTYATPGRTLFVGLKWAPQ